MALAYRAEERTTINGGERKTTKGSHQQGQSQVCPGNRPLGGSGGSIASGLAICRLKKG